MLPIIYSAHHASHNFGEYSDRCGLTLDQRKRYCDLGTADTVPENGIVTLIGTHSRGIVDLNRAPDKATLFLKEDFARGKPHAIWLPGAAPMSSEKRDLKESIYDVYHGEIYRIVTERCEKAKDTLVIAWDNTADYVIGQDVSGCDVHMPSIILSNNGTEGGCVGPQITCDSDFLQALGLAFEKTLEAVGLPHDVRYNQVFRGGYITQHYTNFTKHNSAYGGARVQSLQVEYNMAMTHNQKTLEEDVEAMQKLKYAFSESIYSVLR